MLRPGRLALWNSPDSEWSSEDENSDSGADSNVALSILTNSHTHIYIKGKVFSLQARCVPEVGRGIALVFHDHGTRRG